MMNEDDLLQQAKREHDAAVFDSYTFGCRPQHGTPVVDTTDASHVINDGLDDIFNAV
jgi:hypothetical protein